MPPILGCVFAICYADVFTCFIYFWHKAFHDLYGGCGRRQYKLRNKFT